MASSHAAAPPRLQFLPAEDDVMVEVRPVRSKKELKAFIHLPERIYADDPAWVPPLWMDQPKIFSKTKNPFFEHGDGEFFAAWRGDTIVGRITAQVDHLHNERYNERTAFFGFFESENDPAIAKALLDTAIQWARDRGFSLIRGPFSFGINGIAGVVIKGHEFPPYLEMAHTPPYYQTLLEDYGFEKAKDLIAWRYGVEDDPMEGVQAIADWVEGHDDLTVRTLRMDHFEEDLRIVLEIFNEAWQNNWGYVPLTEKEIKALADEMKLVADPRLIFIAEIDGEPAAVSLTVPNVNQVLHRSRGAGLVGQTARTLWDIKVKKNIDTARLIILGIRPKFRGRKLSILLYCKTHWTGKQIGMKQAELGWTLEDNDKINSGITLMGGDPYKTFRVYDMVLDADAEARLAEARGEGGESADA